jgi:hypothetical protein
VAVGKKSSVLHTTEKFYDRLRESRNNPQKMVNSPLLIADNVGDVLGEAVRNNKEKIFEKTLFFLSSLMFWLNQCNSFYKALVYVCIDRRHFDHFIDYFSLVLVSGLPMEAGLVGLGRLSRAMSMEDADRPRRSSVLTSSPGTASPAVIGSPPKFPS